MSFANIALHQLKVIKIARRYIFDNFLLGGALISYHYFEKGGANQLFHEVWRGKN